MIAFGFIFVTFFIIISIGIRITQKWIKTEKEVENLKRSKLHSEYNALQDQLNPHFLFNNLSVLKSMIIYDADSAVDFTQNFTDVYRYVLQCKGKTTVTLSNELEFIQSYLSLHKERFGEGLNIKISAQKELLKKLIPPLSLQLLVENAIKHNVATKSEPLTIEVIANEDKIWVENNLQPKETSFSTKTGFKT